MRPEVTILKHAVHPEFPSASGIEFWRGNYYGVGDDSPYLYRMNRNFEIVQKFLIKDFPVGEDGRIAKAIKPDFEAMALTEWQGKEVALIVGSGSKRPTRDIAYLIELEFEDVVEVDMGKLYEAMFVAAGFSPEQEINIEGLAISDYSVYFANRGNGGTNCFFLYEREAFFQWMTEGVELPEVTFKKVSLPEVDGFEAGLSGLVYIPEVDQLAFTASLEATDNAYDDGEILGSFVGLLDEDSLQKTEGEISLESHTTMITEDGKPVLTKVESIVLTSVEGKAYRALLASDNDNGPSEFFEVEITF